MLHFTKMQGIGNDYVYIDCFHQQVKQPEALARRISDRHFSIGSDGLVLICPCDKADFEMIMFNADGSRAEMCGNASRCIGKYVYDRGLTRKTEIQLKTGSGLRTLQLHLSADGKQVKSVRVEMGVPELYPPRIPVCLPGEQAVNVPFMLDGDNYGITCVSMGNPHCVIFVANPETFPLEKVGPMIENHPIFPNRTNVEFASLLDKDKIRMRVWERGSGETLACGTGACATLVAAHLNGLCGRKAEIVLNGGSLELEWDQKTGRVFQTGPAEFVFDGTIEEEDAM